MVETTALLERCGAARSYAASLERQGFVVTPPSMACLQKSVAPSRFVPLTALQLKRTTARQAAMDGLTAFEGVSHVYAA